MTHLATSCSLLIPLILLLVENGNLSHMHGSTGTSGSPGTPGTTGSISISINGNNIPCHQCLPTVPTQQGSQIVGAVYFQTNDPKSNAIIVNAIQPDGTLKFSHSVLTQGKGAYSLDSTFTIPPGSPFVDSLNSQDSVIVGDNFLFAVNAGSNTVSMFSINPSNPLIVTFKSQLPSGGDFPVALAYSATLKMLCVLNGGTNNGFLCFDVDTAQGLITAVLGTARSLTAVVPTIANPPLRSFGTFSDILFTEHSTQILVAVKGNPTTHILGFIASYAITGRDFAVSPIIKRIGVTPHSLTIVPGSDEKNLVMPDPIYGFGILTFNSGTLVTAAPVFIGNAISWSDASSRTGNVYMIDSSGSVFEFTIAIGTSPHPTFNKRYDVIPLMIDARIASLAEKDFLYILSHTAENIKVQIFRLDGSGDAKLLAPLVLPYSEFNNKCGALLTLGAQGMAVFVKPN